CADRAQRRDWRTLHRHFASGNCGKQQNRQLRDARGPGRNRWPPEHRRPRRRWRTIGRDERYSGGREVAWLARASWAANETHLGRVATTARVAPARRGTRT